MSAEPKKSELLLDDDRHCFGCGERNPIGLRLKFEKIADGGVETVFTPGKDHQGYKDLLHGGLMALVLDEAMVNAVWLNATPAVSVEIRVRLRHAVQVGQPLRIRAWIEPAAGSASAQKRLVLTRGEARDQKTGRLVAEADAKCLRSPAAVNAAKK